MVWKMGWIPSPTGEPRTQLPPLPVDYIQDKEVLKEYVNRVNTFGKTFCDYCVFLYFCVVLIFSCFVVKKKEPAIFAFKASWTARIAK